MKLPVRGATAIVQPARKRPGKVFRAIKRLLAPAQRRQKQAGTAPSFLDRLATAAAVRKKAAAATPTTLARETRLPSRTEKLFLRTTTMLRWNQATQRTEKRRAKTPASTGVPAKPRASGITTLPHTRS